MEKEFVPYEQALALKKLGFDELCLASFETETNWHVEHRPWRNSEDPTEIASPLYPQAFRWFREKHKLHSRVFFDGLKELGETDEERYDFNIVEQWSIGKDFFDYSYGFKHIHSSRGIYMSYEEAELACLVKLIEIVKEKK